MPNDSLLLSLKGVTRIFGAGTEAPTPVLRGVDLEVAPGESLAIAGPSGSGKSTLLQIMGGLDRPSSGEVLFEGRDLGRLQDAELARVRSAGIGFVFQAHHLLPQCSAIENVLVPALAGKPAKDLVERATGLLSRVGLADRLGHRPGQLSGGECQRVAVVRALINRPRLVLADEPTGALDRAAAGELGRLLLELNREEGAALVVVTHAPSLAESMGRALQLRDGVIDRQ
jgi:lipoprotein-releasing system ATP-binding protein